VIRVSTAEISFTSVTFTVASATRACVWPLGAAWGRDRDSRSLLQDHPRVRAAACRATPRHLGLRPTKSSSSRKKEGEKSENLGSLDIGIDEDATPPVLAYSTNHKTRKCIMKMKLDKHFVRDSFRGFKARSFGLLTP
jgi:hypothetical protein